MARSISKYEAEGEAKAEEQHSKRGKRPRKAAKRTKKRLMMQFRKRGGRK